MLAACFPNGNTGTAQSKDDMYSDPSSITAWAIGLEDSYNQWDVKILSNSAVTSGRAMGYARTGEAASEFSGRGRLLTASHPYDSLSWSVSDKRS